MSVIPNDVKTNARTRSLLIKLELNIAAMPDIPQKQILANEIEIAKISLENNDPSYSEALWTNIRFKIWRIIWAYRILPNQYDQNILLWLKGLVLYSIIVLLIIGPCAVIVDVWPKDGSTAQLPWIVQAVEFLNIDPIFISAKRLIDIKAYYWGVLGGAGAVVSMMKRSESISNQKASYWLVFAQGLFNPIIGSLSAVIACRYYMDLVNNDISSSVPLVVIAFFAGFSERIISSVGTQIDALKKTPN